MGPSTTAGAEPCSGDDRAYSCSATLIPTGELNGFATIPELPTTPVEMTVTISDTDGNPLVHDTLQITPETTYPNGRNCPAGGNQAHIVVGDTGNVRPAGT